jgi:S1-C subfamily serine protease
MRRLLAFPALLALLGLIAAGCVGEAEQPPEAVSRYTPAMVEPLSPDVAVAKSAILPELARDSVTREAKQLTVRVRNVGCQGITTGSGFALAPDILVTNRHVLAGADLLEVSTWDGRSFLVSAAFVGRLGDLGIARVDGRLPLVGLFGPSPKSGASVTAVGYPLGGPLRLSHGVVVDRVDGAELGIPGAVVRITSRVKPGNSGGPLLMDDGRIGGVVYAIERRTGYGLAIPVDTFRRLVRVGGFQDVPPCGSD